MLVDLSTIDLNKIMVDRKAIEKVNPHRHEMALLEGIIWHNPGFKLGVGVWHVKGDEFWVRGHFPGKPLLPGVLQVEAGAQLGVFLYNARFPHPKIVAFTHIEDCCFRNPVEPGDTLYLLAREDKFTERRFTSTVQGVVQPKGGGERKFAFEAVVTGMTLVAR